jgi:hypothetical protein
MFCALGHILGGTVGAKSRFQVLRSETRLRPCRGRQIPFSSFVLSDMFSTVPRASGPIFMFCTPGLFLCLTEGVVSYFHVLRSQIFFRRYRGCRVPFSCLHFRNCFGRTEGVGSRFHVMRTWTHFGWYRGRQVQFSCSALSDSFSTVPRASGPVAMFCAARLVFGGTEGVGSSFHFLRSQARFGRYRGCEVPFSCFALPNSFWSESRAFGPVFMFCAPELVLSGTECVGSHFHILHCRTHFRRYRRRRDQFLCFALPHSFWVVPRASGPVFMFYAPGLVFGGTEGVGYRFHVLRSRTPFGRYRGRRVPFSCSALPESFGVVPRAIGPVFMVCAPRLNFSGTEGAMSHFHVLLSRTRFRRNRGHRVPFSCFALPDLFSVVRRTSGPVYMFCTPGLILGRTEGVRSSFYILRSRTHFRRYRGRPVVFAYFALPDSFLAILRAPGAFFLFCALGHILGGIVGAKSRFQVLHSRTRLGPYRGRRIPFSSFVLPDLF